MEPSLRLMASRKSLSEMAVGPVGRAVPPLPKRGDSGSAEVMKTVCSQIAGVAALQLGSLMRQSTLSFSDHVSGKSRAAVALPSRFGPRHCGQLAASALKVRL